MAGLGSVGAHEGAVLVAVHHSAVNLAVEEDDGNAGGLGGVHGVLSSIGGRSLHDVDDQQVGAVGDDSEDAYDVPITYYTDAVSDQQLPTEYELAVDEERTGLLVFEVPAGETDFSISYLELFDDGTEEGEEGDTFFVYFTAEAQA